jgi:hypothetical protein
MIEQLDFLLDNERDDFAAANVRTSRSLTLSRILNEIWRERESAAQTCGTESLMKFVRRDIPVCSETLSLDLPG